MGLRINTNISSMTTQRHLGNVSNRLQGNYSRLASGLRIANASDDAAGLGISERMRAQIRSYGAARRNAQDGISLVQTAEGALGEVNNILSRMRELSIQAANGTLTTNDRSVVDLEFQALISEVDRISTTTSFNGVPLLDGSTAAPVLQVGIQAGETIAIGLPNASTANIGIAGVQVDTLANASAAIASIDTAIGSITTGRGGLGAVQNRLVSTIASIENTKENLAAAESRIRDVDVAVETADLTRNTIMQQAAVSILSQANQQPQLALNLLQ